MPEPRDPRPLRIAFGGRMQVGKTTAALHLVDRHGFVRHALADPIKEIARRDFGWDGIKDPRGRRLLQEIGDVGRHYDPDIWLDRLAAWLAAPPVPRAVVDDVRLPREVEYLRERGFVIVLVVRPLELVTTLTPGEAARVHATETGLDAVELDGEIDNSGTFEDLYAELDRLVAGLESGKGERGTGKAERPRPGTGPPALGQEETQA